MSIARFPSIDETLLKMLRECAMYGETDTIADSVLLIEVENFVKGQSFALRSLDEEELNTIIIKLRYKMDQRGYVSNYEHDKFDELLDFIDNLRLVKHFEAKVNSFQEKLTNARKETREYRQNTLFSN